MDRGEINFKNVINFFYEISNIPRKSGNEEKISSYLGNFAQSRNLKSVRDDKNNVIIFKQASKLNNSNESIILQCHMDMVCEKRNNSKHDFDIDPLDLYMEDDYIKAKDTTLGADNGIGLAMMLAILDNNNINHPNIEAVFTVEEETTMAGAKHIDTSLLKGRKMICTDNMSEDELWVGCASAKVIEYNLSKEQIEVTEGYKLVSLELSGFVGGHSGRDIGKNRGNSIKTMGEVLNKLQSKYDIFIKQFSGGNKVNVIPRDSNCKLYVNLKEIEEFNKDIELINKELKLLDIENNKNINLSLEYCITNDNKCLTKKMTENIIDIIELIPNGVYYKDKYNNPLVSLNLGNIKFEENEIIFGISIRSNREIVSKKLLEKLQIINEKFNIQEKYSEMLGYEHFEKSDFIDLCKKLYIENFGKPPKLLDVHVGLEAGLFAQKIPNLDFIAIAPNIYNAHSPEEKCSISSIKKVYSYILTILNALSL